MSASGTVRRLPSWPAGRDAVLELAKIETARGHDSAATVLRELVAELDVATQERDEARVETLEANHIRDLAIARDALEQIADTNSVVTGEPGQTWMDLAARRREIALAALSKLRPRRTSG